MRRYMEAEMKLVRWIIVFGVLSSADVCLRARRQTCRGGKERRRKVVIYGSLETPVFEGVIPAFRKKTGITAEYWRASAMSVMNRSMSEYRAGNPGYDVVLNNSDPLVIMANDGMLAQVRFSHRKEVSQRSDRLPASVRSPATASSASFITRDWSSRKMRLSRSKISSIRNTKACW